jgi:hypothetical protein
LVISQIETADVAKRILANASRRLWGLLCARVFCVLFLGAPGFDFLAKPEQQAWEKTNGKSDRHHSQSPVIQINIGHNQDPFQRPRNCKAIPGVHKHRRSSAAVKLSQL